MDSSAIWTYIEKYSPHLTQSYPDILYHYSATPYTLSILNTQQLWASPLNYIRDTSEYQRALKLALQTLEQHFKLLNPRPELIADEAPNVHHKHRYLIGFQILSLLKRYLHAHLNNSLSVCSVSFSSQADSQLEWQNYCPKGGYALGFDSHQIDLLAGSQNFSLLPCYYGDWQELDTIIQGALLGALQSWVGKLELLDQGIAGPELHGQHVQEFIRREAKHVADIILQAAALLKHERYHYEQEWRLITDQVKNQRLEYRSFRGIIMPYKPFQLMNRAQALPVKRIVIASRGKAQLAISGIRGLLEKRGLRLAKASLSSSQHAPIISNDVSL